MVLIQVSSSVEQFIKLAGDGLTLVNPQQVCLLDCRAVFKAALKHTQGLLNDGDPRTIF